MEDYQCGIFVLQQVLTRPSPECVADIQSEIRTWVIKKGVGETMLHRAARLGYTVNIEKNIHSLKIQSQFSETYSLINI